MIKFKATLNGRVLVTMCLERKNIEKLLEGKPIRVYGCDHRRPAQDGRRAAAGRHMEDRQRAAQGDSLTACAADPAAQNEKRRRQFQQVIET